MSMVFGEMNWSDESLDVGGNNRKEFNKDLFLRLSDGSNEVRLITQPYQYLVHKYKKNPEDKKDFGQKILCSQIHGRCPVCDTGDKPKARWLLGVIDRATNKAKILDVSYTVMQQLKTNARNPKIGDPTKYDINIVVNKSAGATGYYTVQTYQKEPLSVAERGSF